MEKNELIISNQKTLRNPYNPTLLSCNSASTTTVEIDTVNFEGITIDTSQLEDTLGDMIFQEGITAGAGSTGKQSPDIAIKIAYSSSGWDPEIIRLSSAAKYLWGLASRALTSYAYPRQPFIFETLEEDINSPNDTVESTFYLQDFEESTRETKTTSYKSRMILNSSGKFKFIKANELFDLKNIDINMTLNKFKRLRKKKNVPIEDYLFKERYE